MYNQPVRVCLKAVAIRDYEFDQFRLTPELYELTRGDRPVRLEKIPFDLLVLLVERRSELVSREAITTALWGNAGLQDVDQSLNTAIRKVRMALRDSSDAPRFIQTVVGRGYKFLPDVNIKERDVSSPVTSGAAEAAVAEPQAAASPVVRRPGRVVSVAGLAVVLIVVACWLIWRTPRDPAFIAVLPFEDLNGDPTQAYMSRGLTEEVITQLGRVAPAGFGVIAGPSVWRYRGTQSTPQKVASDLGAGFIVTGAVEHDTTHVRVSARLIRARDGLQLWAESFDGPANAALLLQADVAVAVARAMSSRLAPESAHARSQPIDAGPPTSISAGGSIGTSERRSV